MGDISLLATLLRKKGDTVLNGKSKLLLTDTLLFKLNIALESLFDNAKNSSFNALETPKNGDQLTYDLYFVYDFIQKTKGLKITHGLNHDHLNIDIQSFKNLKSLELRKIPFKFIHNLHQIHHQLKSIICIMGLQNLEEFFLIYGIDNTTSLNWKELQEANFSYNEITQIDTSLSYAPMLQHLDLSHNRITNAQSISCLPNLRYLNMSYNLLESIPWINQAAFSKLQVLLLKNNFIEDISAINMFKNLSELDLGYNCLINHDCLNALPNLINLTWLSLEGNPLSFHKKHRLRSVQYLNQQIVSNKFVLDRFLLTKSEHIYLGAITELNNSSRSFCNQNRGLANNNSVNGSVSSDTLINSLPTKIKTSKKLTRVRNAIISDDDIIETENEIILPQPSKPIENQSTEHLETKKKIENLRERFGEENWLHNLAGSYVKDILGLPNHNSPSPILSSTPNDSQLPSKYKENISTLVSSGYNNDKEEIPNVSPILDEDSNQQLNSSNNLEETNDIINKSTLDFSFSPIEKNDRNELDNEDEGQTFLLKKEKSSESSEELFFIITKSELKERTIYNGKTRERWPIDSLLSCTKVSNNPSKIHLTYDTVRKIKSERVYIMEEEDEAMKLLQILGNILDSRSLSEMNQIVYKCVKCSSYFSKEANNNSKKELNQECPTCGSALIMKQEPEENQKPLRLRNSISPSSIGSNPATSEKLIVTALVHESQNSNEKDIDSGQICSAESFDISPESQVKKYESDIEIISNPSQSSIEVVDEFDRPESSFTLKNQNYKQSLEQSKQDLKVSYLPGLTESSSSGSYTESICTTFENQSNIEDKKLKENEFSEKNIQDDCPANTYAKIYEGLLETINSKIIETPSNQNGITNAITFSYNNYSQIDHRIKLYLILNVFEDKEEFALIIKSKIYESTANHLFLGCLVFTNLKIYVFNLEKEEGEDPEQLLKRIYTFSLEDFKHVDSLPFQQGVILEINELDNYWKFFLILQDQKRTNNFLKALKDNSLFQTCNINGVAKIYEDFENRISYPQDDGDKKLLHFAILNKCKLNLEDEHHFGLSALIITPNNLLIFENIKQLLFETSSPLEPKSVQNMTNLIEVTNEDFILNLHFLDEVEGTTESWSLEFENFDSLNDTVHAIKDPWEKLFLVSLQILKTN